MTCSSLFGLILFSISCCCFASAVASRTHNNCLEQAKNELEKSYCQILAKGKGKALPSLYDFRKNSIKMQYFLLKKPAKNAGVTLPELPSTVTKPTKAKVPPQTNTPTVTQKSATQTTKDVMQEVASSNLKNCSLQFMTIHCGNREYALQNNLQNYQLSVNALSDNNHLNLPKRNSREYQTATDTQYLTAVYKRYINKMLAIGLADATMSFTKFAATYADQQKTGTDFTQRFFKMYELLKQERKTNGVRSRYNEEYPKSISQCMELTAQILVCDDIQHNWVYRLKSQ